MYKRINIIIVVFVVVILFYCCCLLNFSYRNLCSKYDSLLFQLHNHEDVLESGAHRASNVQQDQSNDIKATWGPT